MYFCSRTEMKRVSNGKHKSQHETVKFILFLKTART